MDNEEEMNDKRRDAAKKNLEEGSESCGLL